MLYEVITFRQDIPVFRLVEALFEGRGRRFPAWLEIAAAGRADDDLRIRVDDRFVCAVDGAEHRLHGDGPQFAERLPYRGKGGFLQAGLGYVVEAGNRAFVPAGARVKPKLLA